MAARGTRHICSPPLQSLQVALDDFQSHDDRAMAKRAEIVRPLAVTDYGSREYTARDLEGNLWSFGTYRPALS